MAKIKITLKDGSIKEFDKGISILDIAKTQKLDDRGALFIDTDVGIKPKPEIICLVYN